MTILYLTAAAVLYASAEAPISLSPGLLESLLAILAGAVVGPIVTAALKRLSIVDAQLGAAINLASTLGLYLLAWWLVTGGDRAVLEVYVVWALAAAGVGQAGNNLWRKRLMTRE